jgi:hypothetical protein
MKGVLYLFGLPLALGGAVIAKTLAQSNLLLGLELIHLRLLRSLCLLAMTGGMPRS